jgi:SAM-dependent methyltransferase
MLNRVAEVGRAQVFGEAADAYDGARPGYPPEVIDLIIADGPTSAVDVGCGTGKAARLILERGVAVVGVEPDERMAAVARRHGVEVVCSPFEAWPAEVHPCVLSAQAWHWVDPVRGAVKAAEVLPAGGRWTAVWNREDDEGLTEVLVDVYKRLAPHLVEERRAARTWESVLIEDTAAGFVRSAAFEPLQRHDFSWTDRLSVAQLVDRLATQSGHRLLPAAHADELHHTVLTGLGGPDTVVTLEYTTMTLTTRRR